MSRASVTGQYAGPVSRAAALAIDVGVVLASYSIGVGITGFLLDAIFDASLEDGTGAVASVVLLGWAALYVAVGTTIAGRTIGKAVVGLKVVARDGRPVGPVGARDQMHHGRGHLGRRGEGGGRQVHDDPRLGDGLGDDRQTAVGVVVGVGDDPLGDLLLEHQGQAGGPPGPGQPLDEQGGADIVGQVGDHVRAPAIGQGGLVDLQSVRLDHLKAAGRRLGEFAQQRQEAAVLLDRNQPAGVAFQERPGQAAGPRTHLDHCVALEGPGQARDLAGDVQVQQEVLAEALLGEQAVGGQALAQGRQIVEAHAARREASSAAVRMAAIRLSGRAIPRPAMSKPVP